MAAAPGGAAPPPSPPPTPPAPPCACSNITIMQLFHELKQQFPAVPDHIVSSTISAHCHDREACASRLQVEAERLLAAVHPARARHPPPHAVHDAPKTCPNRAESPPPKSPDAPPPPTQIKTLNKAHLGSDVLGIETSSDSRPKRPDSLALVASQDSFPLNVSVNLNCRMDIAKGGNVEPSRSVGSPGSYTSLNLTVCTPTSVLDRRAIEEDSRQRGFEGRVQITLSSGPTQSVHSGIVTPRRQTAHEVPEQSPLSPTESRLRRQRLQFNRLKQAIRADNASIASIRREIRILQAPAPISNIALQRTVQQLRDSCQILYRQIEETPHSGQLLQGDDEINDNIITNYRRPIADVQNQSEDSELSWQCHVCTFLNHGLLNKCEECDMPRIILVHADDEITVQLHPGCNKISRSWIL